MYDHLNASNVFASCVCLSFSSTEGDSSLKLKVARLCSSINSEYSINRIDIFSSSVSLFSPSLIDSILNPS